MNLRHVRTSLARFNVASREADRAFQELIGALRAAMVVAQEDEPKQPSADLKKRLSTVGGGKSSVVASAIASRPPLIVRGRGCDCAQFA